MPKPTPPSKPTPPTAPTSRRDATFYLAILALLISVIGTIVSVVDTSILRDQQRIMQEEKSASVWPYLHKKVGVSVTDSTVVMSLSYRNKGLGPAIVTVDHTFDTTRLESTFFLQTLLASPTDEYTIAAQASNDINREVIRPDEQVTAYEISFTPKPGTKPKEVLIEISNLFFNRLVTHATYCSIYGECWEITDDTGNRPERCNPCGEDVRI